MSLPLGDPAAAVDTKDLARDLGAMPSSTSPSDIRTAFVLYELHGQRYREISKIQRCSEKAVERRYGARAREQLRSLLEHKWRDKPG